MTFHTGFTWKGFTISALITGKFDYLFQYSTISTGQWLERERQVWKEGYANQESYSYFPLFNAVNGDILSIQNISMTNVHSQSQAVWYKGDHIRLNEVYLGYQLPTNFLNNVRFIRSVNVFAQARNLGLIWAANKDMDPDFTLVSMKPPKTFTFGLRLNFN
jgi:hypothetical protein